MLLKNFSCSECVFNNKVGGVYSLCKNLQANPRLTIRNREFGVWPIKFYAGAIIECDGFSTDKSKLKEVEEVLKMFLLS